jgi:hypothetical protein
LIENLEWSKMNAFEAYDLYIAVKLHFTQKNYNFQNYNGKTRATVTAFESREDKSFFFRIAKKYPKAKLIDLYVANFVDNPSLWIGDLLDENSEEVYSEWQKKVESLSYHFGEESDLVLQWLETKELKFNDLFQINDSDHPIIVKMALQRVLSLESFIVFNRILDFGKNFNRKLNDVIWNDFWMKVTKYEPFLNIDKEKCKLILRSKIETDYHHVV